MKLRRLFLALLTALLLSAAVSAADYSDVSDAHWANEQIVYLKDEITGYPDGTFRPNANITRAEFAAILSRLAGVKSSYTASLTDIAGHWAASAISAVSAKGWVTGYPDGSFHPNANITRAEAMAMINRMLGRLPASTSDLLRGMKTFSDNLDTAKWYYLHVQEATNGHTYTMQKDGIHETWEALK